MLRSLRTLLVVAAVGALATACGSDSPTSPLTPASVAGTYNLKSYNGATIPALISNGNPRLEVLGDQVVVNANGTWTETATVRTTDVTGAVTSVENSSGTFTIDGATVGFKDNADGLVTVAVFSGITFTVSQGPLTLIYSK
ncbi:MAG: hypothetical protein ABIY52_19130 [Gemmatimonadaceae bacterium]